MTARALRALGAAAVISLACAERPGAPERSSPFDPAGPTGGDPFALAATRAGSAIVLDWNDVRVAESAGYTVYRSRDLETILAGGDTILAAGLDSSGFRDERPLHGTTSYYAVTVRNAHGDESLRSAATAVRLELGPSLEIRTRDDEASFLTDSRHVKLRVIATDATALLLSNHVEDGELVAPESLAYTAEPIDWELETNPPATSPAKSVYARALYAGADTASAVFADTIVARTPAFQLRVDGSSREPVVTGRRNVAVGIYSLASTNDPPLGADSLQIAFAWPSEGPWRAFPGEESGYVVDAALAGAALDTLYVAVKNDFGLAGVDSVLVRGDSLLGARIVVNNAAEPDESPATRLDRVNVHVIGANATAICLSNTPIPPCTAFDSLEFSVRDFWSLAPPPSGGEAVVYAIVANEWRPEGGAVLVDSIAVEIAPLEIVIAYPDPFFGLVYGESTAVEGLARSRTFGPDVESISIVAAGDTLEDVFFFRTSAADTFDVEFFATWALPETGPDTLAAIVATAIDASGARASDTLAIDIFAPAGAPPRRAGR